MPATLIPPVRCPHCWQPLPAPVTPRVLEAARVIRALPGGQGIASDVAAALGISQRSASNALSRALAVGLVRVVGSQHGASGRGRRARVYAAEALIAAYEPHDRAS